MSETLSSLHATVKSAMPVGADVLVSIPLSFPVNTRDFDVVAANAFIYEALRNLPLGFAGLNAAGRAPLSLLDQGGAAAGQHLAWNASTGWSATAAPVTGLNAAGKLALAVIDQGGATNTQVLAWNGTTGAWAPVAQTGGTGGTVDLSTAVDGVTIGYVGGKLVVIGVDLGGLAVSDTWADTDYILKREGGITGVDHFGPVTGLRDYATAGLDAVAALTDAATITTDGVTNKGHFLTATVGAIGRNFSVPTRLPVGSYTWFVTMGVANAAPTFGFVSTANWLGTGGAAPVFSTASGETDAVTIAWSGTAVLGATFAKGS